MPDLSTAPGWHAQDPERTEQIVDYGIHSLITGPLQARGVMLGMVNFWRSEQPDAVRPRTSSSLAEELVARAAVSIDNARRYTREHAMAVTLQRSLLPRALPEQSALDVAYRYLPAQSGVSGDWFDVIPLPGSRVALVVGDVVGHGLHAAATMGRLRTAVHNFSALDLPPDELLGHLDDLVGRIDQDEDAHRRPPPPLGVRRHLPVRDLRPDDAALHHRTRRPPAAGAGPSRRPGRLPRPAAGPPLGLGGLPFETAELELAEGTQLVLYTDGLIEDRTRDIDVGMELLRGALAAGTRSVRRRRAARPCWGRCCRHHPHDDVALLIARTRALAAGPGRRVGRAAPIRPPSADIAGRGLPAARRVGPGRTGLQHGAGPERAGHQRHPLRLRADAACGCCATAP